jgi:formate/nitrite transporter
LVFPVGLAIIVLLGLELVTGAFGIMPVGVHGGRVKPSALLPMWSWIFVGNLFGSLVFGMLLAVALTTALHAPDKTGLVNKMILVATAKTVGYEHAGAAGMFTAFVKAILCNWLVALAVVLAMGSRSTIGKIAAAWLPVTIFYAMGFEHAVVNMFLIPTAMLLGAKITFFQWLVWNQIPVTIGNLVGGYLFTGGALYLAHAKSAPAAATAPAAVPVHDNGRVPVPTPA